MALVPMRASLNIRANKGEYATKAFINSISHLLWRFGRAHYGVCTSLGMLSQAVAFFGMLSSKGIYKMVDGTN